MAVPAHMNAAEYFVMDDASETKHELMEGIPFAMAGGTPEHARVSLAIGALLFGQLAGKPCHPYGSDLRIALKHDTYAYPDCTIICGEVERSPHDPNTVTNPRVVFEVLSPSTEHYDQGRKAFLYQNIPSLQTVVLVSAEMPWAQAIERQEDGSWVIRTYLGADAVVPLPAIAAELPLGRLYSAV